jgi:predicted dienelactone hydrolase
MKRFDSMHHGRPQAFINLIVLIGVLLFAASNPALAEGVGFETVKIANGAESPLTVGIWYPLAPDSSNEIAAAHRLPLVLMSHGGGGSFNGHSDTAMALAHAGIVAAAVSHAGDTFDDQSKVLQPWRRPAQLRRLTDYMLNDWRWHGGLDGARVGAFGFSNGAFTVLVAIGGVPRFSQIGPYCQMHPDHDLCTLLRRANVQAPSGSDIPPGAWLTDTRIKAAVLAAPAFAFTFDSMGLTGVRVPIQLWRAESDQHQPAPFYEDQVRDKLPRSPEYHIVQRAGHYDFLPPCDAQTLRAAPDICTSLPNFDRRAFHEEFNVQVVRFFREKL